MNRVVIASSNVKKAKEIRALLPAISFLTPAEIGFEADIPEPFDTFRENAETKAATIHRFCGLPVLADDSGLCVDALGGAPGVRSARYAGENAVDSDNWRKLLQDMEGFADRHAYFLCQICLVGWGAEPLFFEGRCYGRISEKPSGEGGFGYDPVFIPVGRSETMAMLSPEEKSAISHRGAALREVQTFILDKIFN